MSSVGNGFIGYRWRLVQITHGDAVTEVPTGLDASIEFAADHWVLVDDTVNVGSGPFAPVSGGYTVAELPQTAVAYGGQDPLRQMVIDEMLTLMSAGTVAATVLSGAGSVGNPRLRLTPAAGVSFLFDRDGAARAQIGPGSAAASQPT